MTDRVSIMFGLHEMPWLRFEESLNRYRVLGPLFAERLGLIPGATDLGASIKATGAHGVPWAYTTAKAMDAPRRISTGH